MTNREHFIATLQVCYFGDRNAFEEIIRMYDEKENIIKEVREEVRIYEEQSKDGITNELDNYVFVQRLKNVLDKENK